MVNETIARTAASGGSWKYRVRVWTHRLLMPFVCLVAFCLPAARRNRPVRRSLWSGTPILTLGIKSRAERLLGVEAHSLVYRTYYITHQFDYNLAAWMRWLPCRLVLPYLVLLWAVVRYQRFHFFYDQGLLPCLAERQFNPGELRLLRALGKEVYFWAYGADVRSRERTERLGEVHVCLECPARGSACICDESAADENYARIYRYATRTFSQGDMIEYTPGSRNDLFYWPIDLAADSGRRYAPRFPLAAGDQPLRVVHAPNHRHFKGTAHLLRAIEQLRAEGLPVELVVVEKVPNVQALELYRQADIVFDQCLVGYHGYLALECLAMGKPVMCFIRDRQRYLLAADECPLVDCQVHSLVDDLRRLASNRAVLHSLGVRGRRYIERHYSLAAFAERLDRAYRGIPEEADNEGPDCRQSRIHRRAPAAEAQAAR